MDIINNMNGLITQNMQNTMGGFIANSDFCNLTFVCMMASETLAFRSKNDKLILQSIKTSRGFHFYVPRMMSRHDETTA